MTETTLGDPMLIAQGNQGWEVASKMREDMGLPPIYAPQPLTVTICGSMRFYEGMLVVAEMATCMGEIVLMPFVKKGRPKEYEPRAEELDKLHFRKIDMSHEIIVVTDLSGYVGPSTRREMAYAINCGKLTRPEAQIIETDNGIIANQRRWKV